MFKKALNSLKKIILAPFSPIKNFLIRDLKSVLKNYDKHDGELATCAIAFFLLISFIPASLVIIYLLSFVFESEYMAAFYLDQIKNQLPSINIEEIVKIIDRIVYSKRYLALIWVPFLFWWGSLVFDNVERILQRAFRIRKSRIYWKAKIRHFMIILGMGIIVVILTFLNNFLAIVKNSKIVAMIQDNLNNIQIVQSFLLKIGQIPLFISSITTLIVNSVLIFLVYRFVPPKKLDNISIFKGALFSSISYEIVKGIFSYYITEINDYSSIFGSLSTIVIIMIWIWYTCFIFVIGAEMAWVFYENKQNGIVARK